jgi:hypothetical protein
VENEESRLFPPPRPRHCLPRTPIWRKSLPPHLGGTSGITLALLLLFSHIRPLIFGVVGFPPRHILVQGNPPHITAQVSKALQHQHRRHQNKKRKGQTLGQSKKGKLKQTHPKTHDPFPQGNWVGADVSVHPKCKDPPDASINLCMPQLSLEGAIRAAGFWIPPNCHLSPPEQLDVMVDKGMKEVCTH